MKRIKIMGLNIDRSQIGLSRYLKNYASFARSRTYALLSQEFVYKEKLEELAEASKIVERDNEFRKSLNSKEAKLVKFIAYHNPDEKRPRNYWELFDSVYEKWVDVFFSNRPRDFLSPFALGNVMKCIRENENITKMILSRNIGVDRNTIAAYEKGIRIPPLSYLYKFSRLFDISIDDIVSMTLNPN